MFEDTIVSNASEGLALLERIIDIIRKLFASLLGSSSETTTEAAE